MYARLATSPNPRAHGYYVSAAAHDAPTDEHLMEMALYSPFDYTGLPISVRILGNRGGEYARQEIRSGSNTRFLEERSGWARRMRIS